VPLERSSLRICQSAPARLEGRGQRWLIEHHELSADGGGSPQVEAAPHASRVGPVRRVAALDETHALEGGGRSGPRSWRGQMHEACLEAQELAAREDLVDCHLLADVAESLSKPRPADDGAHGRSTSIWPNRDSRSRPSRRSVLFPGPVPGPSKATDLAALHSRKRRRERRHRQAHGELERRRTKRQGGSLR